MDEAIYYKLNQSVEELRPHLIWSTRILNMFREAEIKTIVDIYRFQEKHNGYSSRSGYGLRCIRSFGPSALYDVEDGLKKIDLPGLEDARRMLKDFDEMKLITPQSVY